jgi:hypothetical protein
MSLHFSLAAWEVKGTGAVWIGDDLHQELMEHADEGGLRLLLRMRDAHADSGYAAYELDALQEEIETLLQHRAEFQPGRTAARLLPSARELGELVEQLQRAVRLAQEWQSDIAVRCD